MLTIQPDFKRMIDLPGVGPCPRPVDIDQSVTGFADLVSMRIYSFSGTATINGDAEGDEVLIVLLDGAASIAVTGAAAASFKLERSGTRAIYLPPEHHYQLTPDGTADVAYMRAKPRSVRVPCGFSADADGLVIEDYADRLQVRLVPIEPDMAIETAAGSSVERLAHALDGTKSSSLVAWATLALAKGETQTLSGTGEVLIVCAKA